MQGAGENVKPVISTESASRRRSGEISNY